MGVEEAPAGVELNVDVELGLAFVKLEVGSMDPNHVANVADARAVLESLCVHDAGDVAELFVCLVAERVHRRVD